MGISGRGSGIRVLLVGGLPFVVLFLAWHLAVASGQVKPFFLPDPWMVVSALWQQLVLGSLWDDLLASTYRVLVGYSLGSFFGVLFGIALGSNRWFRAFFGPFNNFVRYTPLPAFIPLVVLWVGIGDWNPITLIFLGVFWPLVVLVGDAVSNVPVQHIELARTLGLSKLKAVIRVMVPHALPGIYDALRVSVGWAWSSVVLAEIVGANTGLGHMLMESQRFLKTEYVISGIIIVGMLGVLTDQLFAWCYRPLFPWTERARKKVGMG